MHIIQAGTSTDIEQARQLFREYEHVLEVDLCFQGFEAELAGLPGNYAPPRGALLLAVNGRHAVGCIGLRPLTAKICEMKRLYVQPAYRGRNIGRRLAKAVIRQARAAGYSHMRLDTLKRLQKALRLYAALGFQPIPPYCENPLNGVVFLEKRL